MSKYKYTATCPGGTIVTRTTDRVYTHAVVGYWRDEEIPTYGMFEFCGRLDLAQKSYKKWTAQGAKVIVVPVDNPRPEPTDESAAVDMGGDFNGFVEAVNAPEPTSVQETMQSEAENSDRFIAFWQKHVEMGIRLNFPEEIIQSSEHALARAEIGYLRLQSPASNYIESIMLDYRIEQALTETQSETPRVKQLRARIASQERELIDLRFELSQLLEGDE